MSATEILSQALRLSPAERARLTHQLLLSLEREDLDSDWETAWGKELEARLAKADSGQYAAREWRDSLAETRRSLDEGRP